MNAKCISQCYMRSRRLKRREKKNRGFHLTSLNCSNFKSRKVLNAQILNR